MLRPIPLRLPKPVLACIVGVLPVLWIAVPAPPEGDSAEMALENPEDPVRAGSSQARRTPPPGLCSLSTIWIGEGSVIDDTLSPFDEYLGGHHQGAGNTRLWAFGGILLQASESAPPTVVVGHAHPGLAGQVKIEPGGFVTGSIDPLTESKALPALPALAFDGAPTTELTQGNLTLSGPHSSYTLLRLGGDAQLRLTGPLVLHVDRWRLEDQSSIQVDTRQGPIVIRVGSEWSMAPGTRLETTRKDADQFAVLVGQGTPTFDAKALAPKTEEEQRTELLRTRLLGNESIEPENAGPELRLLGEARFNGLLYAPFSKVTITSRWRFQGCLTGRELLLEPGARITSDDQALNAWPGPLR